MTEQEYYSPERVEKRIAWYREHTEKYLTSKYRRDREYGWYLKKFFEEQDVQPNSGYREPMPYNVYFC